MNRLLRFANRLNRFIEKNQFVHESYTASASVEHVMYYKE